MKASDLIGRSKVMRELCEQPRVKFTGHVSDYAFLWAGQSFAPTEDEKLKWGVSPLAAQLPDPELVTMMEEIKETVDKALALPSDYREEYRRLVNLHFQGNIESVSW